MTHAATKQFIANYLSIAMATTHVADSVELSVGVRFKDI